MKKIFRMKYLWVLQILYYVLLVIFVFVFGLTTDTSFLFFFFVSFDFFSSSCVLILIISVYCVGGKGGKKDYRFLFVYYVLFHDFNQNLGALELLFLSFLLLFFVTILKSFQLSRLTKDEIYERYPNMLDTDAREARIKESNQKKK